MFRIFAGRPWRAGLTGDLLVSFIKRLTAVGTTLMAAVVATAGADKSPRPDLLGLTDRPVLFASLAPEQSSTKKHTVISGENDWRIAKYYGVTVTALHNANPGVNWRGLQIGQKINVPGGGSSSSKSASVKKVASKTSHVVVKGDNDVVIAKKYGVKLTALHQANPNVNWRRLQIGQKISVSSNGAATSGARMTNVSRITTAKVRTNREGVRIRREPSTESGTRTTVDKGTVATVLDREGDWYELRFPKGTVGWVRGDMLTPVTSTGSSKSAPQPVLAMATESVDASKAAQLMDTAKSLLGVRYKWGGTSRGGVDCSGFTTYVFAKSGIRLPRTSIEQSRIGERVSKADLQTGDLVFFVTGRRSSRINHVGMYVGDGKFIHASSSNRRVVVSPLSEYMGAFAGARRLPALQKKAAEIVQEAIQEEPEVEEAAPKTADLFPSRVVVGADKTGR